MVMTGHDAKGRYSALELVRLRRSLITAGDRAECPRCQTTLSVEFSIDRRSIGGCRVTCDECGCTLDAPDRDREPLLTRP